MNSDAELWIYPKNGKWIHLFISVRFWWPSRQHVSLRKKILLLASDIIVHKLEWGHGTRLASASSRQLALKLVASGRSRDLKRHDFNFSPFMTWRERGEKAEIVLLRNTELLWNKRGIVPSSSLILNYYFPRQTGRLPAPWGNFYGLKDKLHAVKIINFYSIPLFSIFTTSFSVSFHVKLSYSPTTQSSKNFSHELRLRSSIKYR